MSPRRYTSGRETPIAVRFGRVPWPVVLLLCVVAGIGIASLYSVGAERAAWAEQHAIRFMIGFGLMLGAAVLPLSVHLNVAYVAYVTALALLAAVPSVGHEALGASRWLCVGGLYFQPSELMKGVLVLTLARYYQWLPLRRVSHPAFVLIPVLMIGVPIALTLQQPDLGTAILLAGIGTGMMVLAGVSLWYFAAAGAGAVAAAPVFLGMLHEYQRQRILTFLDPERDPLGSGYQILQSKIALAAGGLSGQGYMQGSQSQLDFVPESHTDFIFALIGEEWGFIGGLFVIGAFALICVSLWFMALQCRSRFARLMIGGTALVLFTYVFVNIAMVTGLMPVVGVPLPLISYGGTSMVALMVTFGVAMCAYINRERDIQPRDLGALH